MRRRRLLENPLFRDGFPWGLPHVGAQSHRACGASLTSSSFMLGRDDEEDGDEDVGDDDDDEDGGGCCCCCRRLCFNLKAPRPPKYSPLVTKATTTPRDPLTSCRCDGNGAASFAVSMTCARRRHSTTLPVRAREEKKGVALEPLPRQVRVGVPIARARLVLCFERYGVARAVRQLLLVLVGGLLSLISMCFPAVVRGIEHA